MAMPRSQRVIGRRGWWLEEIILGKHRGQGHSGKTTTGLPKKFSASSPTRRRQAHSIEMRHQKVSDKMRQLPGVGEFICVE